MPAMVIAWLALAASDSGAGPATFVITAFTMAAVVITWFAFPARDSGTGLAALVITTLPMPAVVVTWLTFAASDNGAGLAALVITTLVASVAAIIAAAVETHVLVADPASHLIGALSARHGAARDTLMDGPVVHASMATAHAHAGRTPTARLTVAAGEECKPGGDYRHRRAHD